MVHSQAISTCEYEVNLSVDIQLCKTSQDHFNYKYIFLPSLNSLVHCQYISSDQQVEQVP